ncbi:unnamed protein product [Meloidogyne enterolobii]|uniref:Uncharacterized protein n=1 Tax=Meloidogyne enterolobii TaxID=390850 RepID=A0ACB0YJU2_MELEN
MSKIGMSKAKCQSVEFRNVNFHFAKIFIMPKSQNTKNFSLNIPQFFNRFKERIRALSRCFSKNVFVSDVEYNVYSSGKNVSRSHLSCLENLNKRKEDWKYVVLLQNHDLPLRTNAELVRIFKAYNGTNDIATKNIVKNTVVKSLDWSLKGLRLYRNGLGFLIKS